VENSVFRKSLKIQKFLGQPLINTLVSVDQKYVKKLAINLIGKYVNCLVRRPWKNLIITTCYFIKTSKGSLKSLKLERTVLMRVQIYPLKTVDNWKILLRLNSLAQVLTWYNRFTRLLLAKKSLHNIQCRAKARLRLKGEALFLSVLPKRKNVSQDDN